MFVPVPGHGRHVVVARGRAGGGGTAAVLGRQLGRGPRALAHRRHLLGHAHAEPGTLLRAGYRYLNMTASH